MDFSFYLTEHERHEIDNAINEAVSCRIQLRAARDGAEAQVGVGYAR